MCTCASALGAAEWGSLKGRFVVDGTPAEAGAVGGRPRIHSASIQKPVNEALVVGKDNALVNAVVYLRPVPTGQKVDIHPDYEAKLKEPVVLDNKGCSFQPHITLVRVGPAARRSRTPIPVGHNTNIALLLVSIKRFPRWRRRDQGHARRTRFRCRSCAISIRS